MYRIVLEQVGHGCDVAKIVDCHDIDVGVFGHNTIRETSDTAKSVNADSNSHIVSPQIISLQQRDEYIVPRLVHYHAGARKMMVDGVLCL